jgi:uncharacterized circularly permuted ATP-grasp superfamily protein
VTAAARGSVEPAYDEAFVAPGAPRPHYAGVLGALAGMDLAALRADVNRRVEAAGVTFTTGEGTQAFVIDPVPRILPADEWPRSRPASSSASVRSTPSSSTPTAIGGSSRPA